MGTYNIDESIADGDHGQLDWAIRVAGAVNDLDLRAAAVETGGAYVVTSGAQTIGGVKTFSSAPVVPDASFGIPKVSGLQTSLDSFVGTSGTQTIGGVKTFSSAPVVPDASFGIPKVNGLQTALNGKVPISTLVFNVKDFGALGDSSTNDTTAIQAAITAAGVTGGTVFFPPGTYRAENLTVPNWVILRGAGLGAWYIPGSATVNGGQKATVTIVRPGSFPSTSTNPVITLTGAASGIEFIEIHGFQGPGTVLVTNGFENYIWNVRVVGGAGIGIDVEKADNTRWGGIFVTACGSATLPAVRIWSKTGAGGVANETNNMDIFGLEIEQSGGTALEVAVGADSTQYWAEWVRIYGLHIENPENSSQHYNTTLPLVSIGNVRAFEVIGYQLYGGTGPIVRHNQQATRTYGNGGVRFTSGTMLGLDPTTGYTTAKAIDLVAGDDFKVEMGRFNRIGTQVVGVASAYGKYAITHVYSDIQVQPKPSVSGTGMTSLSTLNGSTDLRGRVFWTTSSSPAAGSQVQVNLYHPVGTAVCVASPTNSATAAMGLYTAMAADGSNFTLRAANTPAASTAMQADYVITQFEGPF